MKSYSRSHLTDRALLQATADHLAQDRATAADLVADIAEIDRRRLYVPAGYPSMFLYCVESLHLSEDAAYKRIQAGRAAREFPTLFDALADGRIHLSAICLLAPHLTPENAVGLIDAVSHRSKSQIEQLLAERYPRTEGMAMVEPGGIGSREVTEVPCAGVCRDATSREGELAPGQVEVMENAKISPLASERFTLRVVVGQSTHDKLRYAQELLSHQVRPDDLAEVLDRALGALIRQLEKARFAATDRPRTAGRASTNPRHIPALVKRAVWERDGGQCTFVSEEAHRCPARTFLQFDHIDPVACGGQATVDGMRLRCHAHNQYAAEQIFGADFMAMKRQAARRGPAGGKPMRRQADAELVHCLRRLGFRADEARSAASLSEAQESTLEERVRIALKSLGRKPASKMAAVGGS